MICLVQIDYKQVLKDVDKAKASIRDALNDLLLEVVKRYCYLLEVNSNYTENIWKNSCRNTHQGNEYAEFRHHEFLFDLSPKTCKIKHLFEIPMQEFFFTLF